MDEAKRPFQEPKHHGEIQFKNNVLNMAVKHNVNSVKNNIEELDEHAAADWFQALQKSAVSSCICRCSPKLTCGDLLYFNLI